MFRNSLIPLLLATLAGLPRPALADDSAASIAAGGLVARRETRITMAKEVLEISPSKVVVDYDFRNNSDEDVTTEVAFPVPPYSFGPDDPDPKAESFSDLQLTIDGRPTTYQIEAKAFLKGKDVSALLAADKIDIATFGHLNEEDLTTPEFERLPKSEQARLIRLGLFGRESRWGLWTVRLQYHWTQSFPARSTVHIRHEYTPIEGAQIFDNSALKIALNKEKRPKAKPLVAGRPQNDYDLLMSFCPDSELLGGIVRRLQRSPEEVFVDPHWVDFILTTANTWRRPIEDFTLIVDRGHTEERQTLVSFCSPGNAPVKKLDADRFEVHLNNFVPAGELHIGFFDLPQAKPAAKAK